MTDEEDTETDTVTLPVHCQGCGLTVDLTYRPDGYKTGAWSCPRCNRLQRIDLEGRIVRAVARKELPT